MQLLGRAGLAAAVSAAGGLGLVTAGCFGGADDFLAELSLARRLTDKPVGVNISLGIRRGMDEFFDAAVAARVPVVFTSGRNPESTWPGLNRRASNWSMSFPPSATPRRPRR